MPPAETVSRRTRRSSEHPGPEPGRPEGLSDEVLLAGLAAGDQRAAADLVRRHERRVFGIALAITRDRAAAEDVAQEAFLRVWRHAAVFDAQRSSAPTWISTIARNLAIDWVRARRTTPVDPEAALLTQGSPQVLAGTEERALAGDLGDLGGQLRRALGGLPAEQRRVLLRAAYYGQSAAEIAVAEGIPLGTAKSRIRLALVKMRGSLAPEKEALDGPGA